MGRGTHWPNLYQPNSVGWGPSPIWTGRVLTLHGLDSIFRGAFCEGHFAPLGGWFWVWGGKNPLNMPDILKQIQGFHSPGESETLGQHVVRTSSNFWGTLFGEWPNLSTKWCIRKTPSKMSFQWLVRTEGSDKRSNWDIWNSQVAIGSDLELSPGFNDHYIFIKNSSHLFES